MKLLKGLLSNVVICGFLLRLFTYFQLGIQINISPTLTEQRWHRLIVFAIIGAVFRLLNSPIKWLIKLLSFPVNMLTLGAFSLVINVAIFYLFTRIINAYFWPDIIVQLWSIIQTLILSLIMSLGITILKKLI